MTVGELIERLSEFDRDTLVVQSRDPEGNGHMPTVDVESGLWDADGWETVWCDENGCDEDGEPIEGLDPCVVLWP